VKFIRKVFSLLTLQLLVTTAMCWVTMMASIAPRVASIPLPIQVVAGISSIALLLALRCFKARHPHNLILLGLWTLSMALSLSTQCSVFAINGDRDIVTQAAGTTLVIFVSLTAFVFQSKIDFSFLRAGLCIALVSLMLWSLCSFLCGLPRATTLYSIASAIIFCGYVLYDTHRVIRRFTIDQYVEATIELYLDIVNLFINILRLLKALKQRQK
jgi:FtsH-binding integral membrane protein